MSHIKGILEASSSKRHFHSHQPFPQTSQNKHGQNTNITASHTVMFSSGDA